MTNEQRYRPSIWIGTGFYRIVDTAEEGKNVDGRELTPQEAADRLNAQANRIAELEAALKPFASFGADMKYMGRPYPQSGPVYSLRVKDEPTDLTVEDFQRARELIGGHDGG